MEKVKTANMAVDDKYIEEAVTQSMGAYKNLCLLAMKRRANLTAMCSAVNTTIRKTTAANRILLQVEFDGIAYISSLAGALGKSLISILYMGQKEQEELLRCIIKSITIDEIAKYKEFETGEAIAAEFEAMLPVEGSDLDTDSGEGYLLTFRKHRNLNGLEFGYTLQAEYKTNPRTTGKIPPFMADRVLIKRENDGIVSDFIERIILLKPSGGSGRADVSKAGHGTRLNISNENKNTKPSFEEMLTELKQGLNGEAAPDNSDEKMVEEKASKKNISDSESGINRTGIINEKRTYRLIPCAESISKYLNEQTEKRPLRVTSKAGKTYMIPAVVDKGELKIYIDLEYYKKYKALLKKDVESSF